MDAANSRAYREIISQPERWRRLLEQGAPETVARALGVKAERAEIILTGCGTTYALGLTAAATMRRYGIRGWAWPASDLAFYPREMLRSANVMIAISRSGSSTETLWAAEAFRKSAPGGRLLAVTTHTDSALAGMADAVLDAAAVSEESVPETRSFTGMLLLLQLFAARLAGKDALGTRLQKLPDALNRLLPEMERLARQLAEDKRLNRFFFLGNGPLHGIAMEGMFKMKELAGSWAESYHALEFRHGPRAVVNDEALVAALISDGRATDELRVLSDMQKQGAQTLAVMVRQGEGARIGVDHTVELGIDLDEYERSALCMPIFQLLGLFRALGEGKDPDHPANLSAVTKL